MRTQASFERPNKMTAGVRALIVAEIRENSGVEGNSPKSHDFGYR
jgi:hypothetical protein